MKTRLFLFFGWILILVLFGNIAQALVRYGAAPSVRPDPGAISRRFGPRLSVRFDAETGADQIFHSTWAGGKMTRLTASPGDKASPQWGPKNVTYYFYDHVENVIRKCEDGDLFYYVAETPSVLHMGCFAGIGSSAPVTIADYPLSAWGGFSDDGIADYHVALGEDVSYEKDGFVHEAYPVIVETSDGNDVLVLHDDEAHLGETDHEDGFVFYDEGVPVGEDGVIPGNPDAGWEGTVRCPDCVGQEPSGDGQRPEESGAECDDQKDSSDCETLPCPENDDGEISANPVSNSSSSASLGDQTITINNEIIVSVSPTSEGTSVVQNPAQTEESEVTEESVPAQPDVSAEIAVPQGSFEMSGDAIGSCALQAAGRRPSHGNGIAFFAMTFGLLFWARHVRVKLSGKRVITALFGAVLLIAQQGALPAVAAENGPFIRKIALVPVGESASALKGLAEGLRHHFRGRGSVLPIDDVLQALVGSSNRDDAVTGVIRDVDAILDSYYAYRADASLTRRDLDRVVTRMRAVLPPSREASRLLVSASITLAWLDFKLGDRAGAERTLGGIFETSSREDLHFEAYPKSFRSFAKALQERQGPGQGGTLSLHSHPDAVNVYLDGFFIGVTPVRAAVRPGTYRVGFEAAGRSPEIREVIVENGKTKAMRARLRWLRRGERENHGGAFSGWEKSDAAGRTAIAGEIARLTEADTVVLISAEKTRAGHRVAFTPYEARYGQLMKEIPFGKLIGSLSDGESEVAAEFGKKLSVALSRESSADWSRGAEREIVIDHRVARRLARPFYRKPAFWAAAGGVAAIGVIAGVMAAQGGGPAGPGTGGVVVGF